MLGAGNDHACVSQLNSLGDDLESRVLLKHGKVCPLFLRNCLSSALCSSFSLASARAALGPVGLWSLVGSPGAALGYTSGTQKR